MRLPCQCRHDEFERFLGGLLDVEPVSAQPGTGTVEPGAAEPSANDAQPSPMADPGGSETSSVRRTVAWWRTVRDHPLYQGCQMTVAQLSYVMLREKRQGRIRNNTIDR